MPRIRKSRARAAASSPLTSLLRRHDLRRQMTLHEWLWKTSPEACRRRLDSLDAKLKEAEDFYLSRTGKEGNEWSPIDLTLDSDTDYDDDEEELVIDLPFPNRDARTGGANKWTCRRQDGRVTPDVGPFLPPGPFVALAPGYYGTIETDI